MRRASVVGLLRLLLEVRAGSWPGKRSNISQAEQDVKLQHLFEELHISGGAFVEFGYPMHIGSNTHALTMRGGWTGQQIDGDCPRKFPGYSIIDQSMCRKERIYSTNIVQLFRKYAVPKEAEYVSIDIDTYDVWVLAALLSESSEFRPKVLTVEYNSNFPYSHEAALAFPDPTWPSREAPVPLNPSPHTGTRPARATHFLGWDKECYFGSSARAIELVAKDRGYVVVDIEPGFDVFLVRADLWGDRPLPRLRNDNVFRPFNVGSQGQAHRPMGPERRREIIDYAVLRKSKGENVEGARAAAGEHVRAMEQAGNVCFQPHPCATHELARCPHLYSFLCPGVCEQYPPSFGVPLWRSLAKKSP